MSTGNRVTARPVTDGRRVRWTLEQVRQADGGKLVRIDWLRCTVPLAAVVGVSPELPSDLGWLDLLDKRGRDVVRESRGVSRLEGDTGAMAVARAGARHLVAVLGFDGFKLGEVEDKGMDYYAARCPVLYEGKVVAYALAGGKSANQADTVHLNIFGGACLYVSHANWSRLHGWIKAACGHITRVDLAVDVFSGDDIEAVRTAYLGGEFDVMGKRPSQSEYGSWTLGHSRTFEVGKRQTGKCLRAYEKGDEQFGPEANDAWIRYEVEIRNSSRVIDLDVLTRPADFFAGAYPFCESLLARLGESAQAERIKTGAKLQDATAEAAVTRGVRWFARTAAPMFCRLLEDGGEILSSVMDRERHRLPGRFSGFTRAALVAAMQKVGEALAPGSSPSNFGAVECFV